jgi:D-alanine--poly(phosphoribitol) ligase subunit 1
MRAYAAIADSDQVWTYADLDNYSQLLRSKLASHGLRKGDVVGIFNSKAFEAYATMLACLRSGLIYTNIDPNTPSERLGRILDTCQPRLIVIDCSLSDSLITQIIDRGIAPFYLNEPLQYEDTLDFEGQNIKLTWNDPAYIMFTSGSTGFPKGATITHGGLISFISWGIDYFKVNSNDRFAQLSPMYFDNSVFDFYIALFSGACLVPVRHEIMQSPMALIEYVSKLQCSVWFSVPSLLVYLMSMRALTYESLRSIRVILFGGEGFPKAELRKLFELVSGRIRLVNVYGPTECTCICSAYDITERDCENLRSLAPLGKINKNFDYLIVDEHSMPVCIGGKGELVLLGPNVGLGYYNDTKRTNEHFIQNPQHDFDLERGYKTGDIVYEEGGLLFFVGRTDNQIKHMGYRIELEEIEAALHAIEGVIQAGVIYKRTRLQHGLIVAFVQQNISLTDRDITQNLSTILPNYMLPNRIIFSVRLPKNANGKVDRRALHDLQIE